jgi:hypothetical protein
MSLTSNDSQSELELSLMSPKILMVASLSPQDRVARLLDFLRATSGGSLDCVYCEKLLWGRCCNSTSNRHSRSWGCIEGYGKVTKKELLKRKRESKTVDSKATTQSQRSLVLVQEMTNALSLSDLRLLQQHISDQIQQHQSTAVSLSECLTTKANNVIGLHFSEKVDIPWQQSELVAILPANMFLPSSKSKKAVGQLSIECGRCGWWDVHCFEARCESLVTCIHGGLYVLSPPALFVLTPG